MEKQYKARRKKGLRGQLPVPTKFIPKGEPVAYTNREGKEALYPNDAGHHMLPGWGMVNRVRARRKQRPVKIDMAEDLRKEQRAAKHARRNAGEHERALKRKEAK